MLRWFLAILLIICFNTFAMEAKAPPVKFKLVDATIASVHHAIMGGQLTCEQLINLYIGRIKKYNFTSDDGPPINAFAVITPTIID